METKQKKRNEVPDEYKWNLDSLATSDKAWKEGIDSLSSKIDGLSRFKGRLGEIQDGKANTLLECLNEQAAISEPFYRLYVYANMKLHEDANETKYQGFVDISEQMRIQLMAAESFIVPEILAIAEKDESVLLNCIDTTPGLELYRHSLMDTLRNKAHVLSPEIEEILARVYELGEAPDNIYSMMTTADIKFGTVKDEEGKTIELTHGRYGAMLESYNREVRKEVWHTYYDKYWYLKNTITTTYSANVKKDVFFAKTRKHDSALNAALFSDNIPMEVYTGLIDTIHEFLPQMHRYIKMRKKALDLPELQVYDLFTPLVKQIDTKTPYAEAVEKVLASLAPLGEEYVSASKAGLSNGWIDIYENEGKRSGAYAWGAYGGHPYILMNYVDKVDDMFTLAHELGHAMHSYYSWKSQPYIYSDYTIFLAEVASTVNEALLMDYLLKSTDCADLTTYLINTWLNQFRSTVFRQTKFAEFEMIAHRMAEEGEPLTTEALNKVYRDLNVKYYGDSLVLDDKLDLEWARIPHFYRAFYVYQYATGYSAAMAFANRILGKTDMSSAAASEKYLEFLKAGSSDYSINILKNAGVDMSSPEPVREAMTLFTKLLDDMEGRL